MGEERYDILKLLGKGRTGGVYEAEDTRLGRKVAMRRFFAQNDQTDVSEYEEEFKEIAQSLGALQHPNLLRVFDAGMDEDGAFIISQLMKGDSLHNRLKEGPLSDWDVWDLGHQMLDALSAAHDGGFVHGAITPGSILMSPRARGGYLYVILDMGLSRLAPLIQGKDSFLAMMADPAILAPELFDNSEATEKGDLYMLGNILYMCLAGGHPFGGKSLEECEKLHNQGLPDLKEFAPDTPQEFLDWIGELCKVNPDDRPSSVVVALKSMPKVAKPPRMGVTPIHTTAGAATIAPATNLTAQPPTQQAGYGGLAPGMATTGPLTAGTTPGIMPQTTHGQLLNQYQASKKSYKALIITVITLIVLGGGLYFLMSDRGKKTGEEIAAEKAKKEQEEKVGDEAETEVNPAKVDDNIFPLEEILSVKIVGGEASAQGWKKYQPRKHRLSGGGWTIHGANGQNPGLGKKITATDIEDMYKRGWTIKYVVKAVVSEHTMGMIISSDENEYWGRKDLPVSLLFKIERSNDDVILSSPGVKETVQVTGSKDFLTIELRGKAKDPQGSFQLFLNGNIVEQFTGVLSQEPIKAKGFEDQFFTFSGNISIADSKWTFTELTMNTGTPEE